ncbi:MAG: peptidoglycan-binding domain-containing protein [Patescibacteria group bacterium]
MKTYLTILLALLFLPVFVFAANNAILNTDVILTLGSENVTVSGGNATIDSIIIDGTSAFSLTLSEGQSIQVTSSGRRLITATEVGSIRLLSMGCGDSSSIYKIENPTGGVTATTTVTVPSTGTCSGGGSLTGGSGGSGGSGGGGGGSYTYVPPTSTTTTVPKTTTTTTTATTGATTRTGSSVSSGAIFTKVIKVGASSSEIKILQQFLNSDPDTKIAESGAGAPGKETNYFGLLTTKAIQKFQKKYGIVSSGTPTTTGYGSLGPKTRTKLNELMGASSSSSPTTTTTTTQTTPTTPTTVTKAGLQTQLQALQAQLQKMLAELKAKQTQ